MEFSELYKIVNYIDRILRYREPIKIIIENNTLFIKCKNGTPTVVYKGDINNIYQVLNALKVINELIPLVDNVLNDLED